MTKIKFSGFCRCAEECRSEELFGIKHFSCPQQIIPVFEQAPASR